MDKLDESHTRRADRSRPRSALCGAEVPGLGHEPVVDADHDITVLCEVLHQICAGSLVLKPPTTSVNPHDRRQGLLRFGGTDKIE